MSCLELFMQVLQIGQVLGWKTRRVQQCEDLEGALSSNADGVSIRRSSFLRNSSNYRKPAWRLLLYTSTLLQAAHSL